MMPSILLQLLPTESWSSVNDADHLVVVSQLGKEPQGEYSIAVRKISGEPVVIENAPFFYDGTPMPTRYWLVDPQLVTDVSMLESIGGVKKVQEEIAIERIQEIHERHSATRDELIDSNYEGPKPTGGVGGTRKGVKCLHAHVANYLATGNDEIGKWALNEVEKMKESDT